MLRLFLAVCIMCWATFATAQEPPNEDGIGPYRFGMSLSEARETAPNASWAVEQEHRARVLSGGPPVIIGGRLAASLVFIRDRLQRIVLVGATTGACTDAVGGMVETLEELYGVFASLAPHSHETGRLRETFYTELGSEIRSLEHEGRNVAVSARYGQMYAVVRGEPENDTCRLAVTLGSQLDWQREEISAGPAWADIDAARSLPDPEYAVVPTARTFARHYPEAALMSGISGVVALDCLVLQDRSLNCRVAEEAPARQGFAPAALAIARDFSVRQGEGDSVIGRRLRVPIRFNASN